MNKINITFIRDVYRKLQIWCLFRDHLFVNNGKQKANNGEMKSRNRNPGKPADLRWRLIILCSKLFRDITTGANFNVFVDVLKLGGRVKL